MTHAALRTEGLSLEMQVLLRDYPRDAWPDNPHFTRSIQNWMGAHQMFRQLGEINANDTEAFLDRRISTDEYVGRLGYYGDQLVKNLHGHHTWEDRQFFPELSRADQRFDQGLETLESDHELMDNILDNFTRTANRVITLASLDESQVRDEAAKVHAYTQSIESFLNRHLQDEEDLVVPIILHHKLRG